MNSKKLTNIALAVLPLIAVVLAGMPNAVTVYQMTEEAVPVTCSFFTLIEDVDGAVCLPYAGIFGALAFGLAVIYLVKKNHSMLKWIVASAFAATTLAVVPVLVGGDILLVPNMLIPILLGVACLLAFAMMKLPADEKTNEPRGRRLN